MSFRFLKEQRLSNLKSWIKLIWMYNVTSLLYDMWHVSCQCIHGMYDRKKQKTETSSRITTPNNVDIYDYDELIHSMTMIKIKNNQINICIEMFPDLKKLLTRLKTLVLQVRGIRVWKTVSLKSSINYRITYITESFKLLHVSHLGESSLYLNWHYTSWLQMSHSKWLFEMGYSKWLQMSRLYDYWKSALIGSL